MWKGEWEVREGGRPRQGGARRGVTCCWPPRIIRQRSRYVGGTRVTWPYLRVYVCMCVVVVVVVVVIVVVYSSSSSSSRMPQRPHPSLHTHTYTHTVVKYCIKLLLLFLLLSPQYSEIVDNLPKPISIWIQKFTLQIENSVNKRVKRWFI